jgi:hypothetical protein
VGTYIIFTAMTHTVREKRKLLARVRLILLMIALLIGYEAGFEEHEHAHGAALRDNNMQAAAASLPGLRPRSRLRAAG